MSREKIKEIMIVGGAKIADRIAKTLLSKEVFTSKYKIYLFGENAKTKSSLLEIALNQNDEKYVCQVTEDFTSLLDVGHKMAVLYFPQINFTKEQDMVSHLVRPKVPLVLCNHHHARRIHTDEFRRIYEIPDSIPILNARVKFERNGFALHMMPFYVSKYKDLGTNELFASINAN